MANNLSGANPLIELFILYLLKPPADGRNRFHKGRFFKRRLQIGHLHELKKRFASSLFAKPQIIGEGRVPVFHGSLPELEGTDLRECIIDVIKGMLEDVRLPVPEASALQIVVSFKITVREILPLHLFPELLALIRSGFRRCVNEVLKLVNGNAIWKKEH